VRRSVWRVCFWFLLHTDVNEGKDRSTKLDITFSKKVNFMLEGFTVIIRNYF